jgi:hypothetical protein
VVTFLFTDIEGSTGRWEADADVMRVAVEASDNPCARSYALLACGFALRDAEPNRALDTHRRALAIAQESGNRWIESSLWRAASAASKPSKVIR